VGNGDKPVDPRVLHGADQVGQDPLDLLVDAANAVGRHGDSPLWYRLDLFDDRPNGILPAIEQVFE
jgi:hypothetical protein